MFQSRNRDACHFRMYTMTTYRRVSMLFQSRNRDACHFRSSTQAQTSALARFNLAIEMLIISGCEHESAARHHIRVSISQSRCLSFQARWREVVMPLSVGSFNLAIEMLVISGTICPRRTTRISCFNLAIEMLVISGDSVAAQSSRCASFQSRNRDACHFRPIGGGRRWN